MREIKVNLDSRSYPILIKRGILEQCGYFIRRISTGKKLAVFTDENVYSNYGTKVIKSLEANGFSVCEIVLPTGEGNKQVERLSRLYEKLVQMSIKRNDAIIALGGGVIGDLAGFIASTYMRGIFFNSL